MNTESVLTKKLVVFSLVLLVSVTSCKNKIEDINALTLTDTLPVETGKNIEIIYSDSAKIQTLIKSPFYKKYAGKNPYIEMPQGIDAIFYDSAMRIKTRLTAKYAIKYDKKHVMEVKNNVVVINEKKERLNTEHLIWDEELRRIYTDQFVKITTPDKVFYGDGLDADDSFMKWVIKKPRGSFFVNTDEEDDIENNK
ncbi:MAG TPA: LPS export ABC transporter periplasmic protein LptC [Bacteroidales bacterium]|nr:LPS export ABC transporter periplasmic protein LptC [Bacteroidales bacterium]HPS27733.1 LPS export ABC transporter periplasmic protein LptC [Bacteroidales bacterium]